MENRIISIDGNAPFIGYSAYVSAFRVKIAIVIANTDFRQRSYLQQKFLPIASSQ